jgi:hypothetical protein
LKKPWGTEIPLYIFIHLDGKPLISTPHSSTFSGNTMRTPSKNPEMSNTSTICIADKVRKWNLSIEQTFENLVAIVYEVL